MKKIITAVAIVAGFVPALVSAQIPSVSVGTNASAGVSVTGVQVKTDAQVNASTQGMQPMTPEQMRAMRNGSSTMRMSSTTRQDRMDGRMASTTNRGDTEISARIKALNALETRIDGMKNVSDSQKAQVSAEVQTEIMSLTSLEAKINADGTSTLKQDVSSITDAYRIYALVIPQEAILSAADRADTLVTSFTAVSAKLQVRINAAQAADKDVTALNASLADLTAKIADVKIQSQTAVTAVASLTPDNGNAAIAASNKTSLNAGQTAIKAAMADLQAADKDAKSIIQGTRGVSVSASASSSVSTQ